MNKKIFISVDIEGVAGISHWNETTLNNPEYKYYQQVMVDETVACCNTLIKMGITDIYVRDAHDSARNLIPNQLPKSVKLIRDWAGSPCDMMSGLDESFDGAIFIGYHSPSRSDGNPLAHTLVVSPLNHIKINGKVISEFQLNTYYAKTMGVPVIMVSGDENLTKIVKRENDLIETVATNTGLHGAIIAKHPDLINDQISIATKKAIENLEHLKDKIFVTTPKVYDTEIHFKTHKRAYRASFYPGASLLNSDKVIYTSTNIIDTLKFIMFTT